MTQPELMHALACVREAGRFDVVSDHTGALGLALSNLTETPFLSTVHGALAGRGRRPLPARLRAHARRGARVADREPPRTAPDLPWAATIPNAIALNDSPVPRPGRGGEYLFWLGRMSADKGPVTAIEVARAAGMPLVLAGKLRLAEEQQLLRRARAAAARRWDHLCR